MWFSLIQFQSDVHANLGLCAMRKPLHWTGNLEHVGDISVKLTECGRYSSSRPAEAFNRFRASADGVDWGERLDQGFSGVSIGLPKDGDRVSWL